MNPPRNFDQHIGIYISFSHVRTFLISLLSCLIFGCDKQPAAPSISGIALSTTCAAPGHVVTIAGDVLRSKTLKISVGTLVSRVIATDGISASFEVPFEAPIGSTNIVLQRQPDGQELSRIPFKVGECNGTERTGFRLPGQDSTRAIQCTFSVLPDSVRADEIKDGIFLSRLDAYIDSDASVGQINAALDKVNGRIAAMLPGSGAITIAIPVVSGIDELRNIKRTLDNSPGIKFACIAHELQNDVLPGGSAGDLGLNEPRILPLLPTRFPAAWNALGPCSSKKIDIVVTDSFSAPPPLKFSHEIPESNFELIGSPPTASNVHGYDVVGTLAGQFNDTDPTGANPFPGCLRFHAIQRGGLTPSSLTNVVFQSVPAGKFLWNYSAGFASGCGETLCDPNVAGTIVAPKDRAYDALEWKLATEDRWDDFVMITCAGNERDADGTPGKFPATPDVGVYPGLGIAACNSSMNLATLSNASLFLIISNRGLWDPQPGYESYRKLTAKDEDLAELTKDIPPDLGPANNVLIAGSTLRAMIPSDAVEAPFSNAGADIYTVGEGIFSFGPSGYNDGTSFSAPQVTALAAYLWMRSDDLREHQPSSITKRAILANARTVPTGSGATSVMNVLDAYASVLSLDPTSLPNPSTTTIRLAILDVNGDGVFDEMDVRQYLDHYLLAELEVEPKDPDFSRFDLNGDGFTGGSKIERFDLDRVGSTQYGDTSYTTVAQVIEDEPVEYDEMNLTDKDILCYYAYSGLYVGMDVEERKRLLTGVCNVVVTVSPTSAAVEKGKTRQFTPNVLGTNNKAVTWDATGGTIDHDGLFTAGNTPGDFAITATSAANIKRSATATVRVPPVSPPLCTLGISPLTMSVPPSGQVRFTAQFTGTSNSVVTWTAGGGSIDSNGLFTAGSATGTFEVRATSVDCGSATARVRVSPCALINRSTCEHGRYNGYAGEGPNGVRFNVQSACGAQLSFRIDSINPPLQPCCPGISFINVVPAQNPPNESPVGSHTARVTFFDPARPEETLTLTYIFTMDPPSPEARGGGTTRIIGECTPP